MRQSFLFPISKFKFRKSDNLIKERSSIKTLHNRSYKSYNFMVYDKTVKIIKYILQFVVIEMILNFGKKKYF